MMLYIFMSAHTYARKDIIFHRCSFFLFKRRPQWSLNGVQPNFAMIENLWPLAGLRPLLFPPKTLGPKCLILY